MTTLQRSPVTQRFPVTQRRPATPTRPATRTRPALKRPYPVAVSVERVREMLVEIAIILNATRVVGRVGEGVVVLADA